MSFSRRAEILFDPKVYFEAPDLKPYSTSLCQVSRLRRFRNTQQVGIKMSGLLFTSSRHGELNVMDSSDFAFAHEGRLPPAGFPTILSCAFVATSANTEFSRGLQLVFGCNMTHQPTSRLDS